MRFGSSKDSFSITYLFCIPEALTINSDEEGSSAFKEPDSISS